MNVVVCIPFRDRGIDPLRAANLERVVEHWSDFGCPVKVFDDKRRGTAQFCRSAAYNRAVYETDADVIVYAESDMLLDHKQVRDGIELAANITGLVVPFTEYRYLGPDASNAVRVHTVDPVDCQPDSVIIGGGSIGAVNIVSRKSIAAVGQWDENFEGSWWDDRAMKRAFEVAAGPTRWLDGAAYHLFHLPGWTGLHLTAEDQDATARNEIRYQQYMYATTPDQIRRLTK